MTLAQLLQASKRKPDQTHTHTSFGVNATCTLHIANGSVLREKLFTHVQVTRDLSQGENSITEKVLADSKFRLFFDIDFKTELVRQFLTSSTGLTAELQKILHCVKETLQTVVTQEPLIILATRLPYKIHLHCPDVIVTTVDAKRICELIKNALKVSSSLYDESAIDTSVYKTGLRMLWCHKGRMGKPGKIAEEKKQHEEMFGRDSWSAVYDVTDETTWEKKAQRTLQDLELTSIVADAGSELTPLSFTTMMTEGTSTSNSTITSATIRTRQEDTESRSVTSISRFNRSLLNKPLLLVGNPVPDWQIVVPYLSDLGFVRPTQVSTGPDGYDFDAGRTTNCPLCKTNCHDSNHWYCLQIMPEMLYVKNYSNKCRSELVTMERASLLNDILQMPDTDADYAKLFSKIYQGVLFWTWDGRFMGFQNNRWCEVPKEEVRECCRSTLLGILERMSLYLNEKRRWFELYDSENRVVISTVKKEYANLLIARRYVKSQRHLKDIMEVAKDYLWNRDFEKDLDANVFLMGTNNGIIDLKTCEIRSATPDDMVSKTVGYDSVSREDADPVLQKEFATFIEQIYPVAEQREIVQRYLGYCLLGDHREKVLLLLTDKRKGFNGKSTMAKIVMQGMGGDYARRGGNGFLYKSDTRHETVNSHQSGMIAYKGYRLAYFEELDPKERFDNQEIKDRNGGNSYFQGRRANSTVEEKFIWGTKMILLFNDSNFPKFDYTDTSLLDRFLIVQHQSRFYKDVEGYEKHKHQPYTYLASDVDSKLESWRPYYLLWALEGLKNYWEKRFGTVPKQCKEWKAGLVREQDQVRDFLDEYTRDGVSSGKNTDVISGKTLFQLFNDKVSSHSAKKDRLLYKHFLSQVEELWETTFYKEKSITRETKDGAKEVKYYGAFVGHRMVVDKPEENIA